MKVLFCAYRDWAIKASAEIRKSGAFVTYVTNLDDMVKIAREQMWDVIIVVGWSWKVPNDIVNSTLCIGMHPSDLPAYAGGSPIQNQVLNGIEETKATLFRLRENFDSGEIIDKEDISLQGHLSSILENICQATSKMLVRFVSKFPNNEFTSQPSGGNNVRRLKPEHSKLPNPAMTCKEMWNHIRCREDPYPNAYFEDETGRLVIKLVEFEPK